MAGLVVLLRGVNVGGHRRLRPSELVAKLRAFDVVNIGAAGTFVVRKPGASPERFCAALRRLLPFVTDVVVCDGGEWLRLVRSGPFGGAPAASGCVRFLTVLAEPGRAPTALPLSLPDEGEWLVQIVDCRGQFALGVYRRHMKTIGYLGRIDKLFGTRVTTRNWNTVEAIAKALSDGAAGTVGPAVTRRTAPTGSAGRVRADSGRRGPAASR